LKETGLNEDQLKEDLTKQATNNLTMILILDKVIEEKNIELDDFDTKEIEDHLKNHDDKEDEMEITSHRLNLENEQIRNKALIHLMNTATPIDSKGEEVYLKDVYTQDRETREEE
jgi:FKBP-type peptidyl-prolyl cis-trans isomerase (trigger factor)